MSEQNKIYYILSIRGDIIKDLIKTAAWVTILSVAERFLGFIYRIYLSRTIGPEGIGIYQITLTIFGLLLTITSSGIPITVSRLMTRYKTENNRKAEQSTVTSGLLFCILLSVPIILIFVLFNDKISFIFTDSRCMTLLLIILPGLTFTSFYAVLRGAFWGNKDFAPYSIIELLEEAVMVVIGIALIGSAPSVTEAVNRAGWAVLASYIFSFTTALSVYLIRGGRFYSPKGTLRPLFSSATPITCMRTATSLINSLVAVILPAQLISTGLSSQQATAQFGAAFGMAMPIIFIPATLIGSVALVLVPELSESFYKNQTKNLRKNIDKALKFSISVACLTIPVLLCFGKELGMLFYKSEEAGIYLAFAAPIILPMSVCMISTSILNSMNMEKRTLLYYSFGAIFMLASIYLLPKLLGVYALFIGLAGQFTINAIFNLVALNKKIKAKQDYVPFALKAVLFILPTCALGYALVNILQCFTGNTLTCILGGTITAAFNALFYLLFGLIPIESQR